MRNQRHDRFLPNVRRTVVSMALLLYVPACTLLVSTDDLAGGGSVGANEGEAGISPIPGLPDDAANRPDTPPCAPSSYCHSAAPSDWRGPGILVATDADAGADGGICSDPIFGLVASDEIVAGPIAEDAACGCACGPTTGSCSYSFNEYSADCSTALGVAYSRPSGSCVAATVKFTSYSNYRKNDPIPSVSRGPIRWSFRGRFCAGAFFGAGCATGGLCIPGRAPQCVVHKGDVPCPGSPYARKSLLFASWMDNRGCTACKCTRIDDCAAPPTDCGGTPVAANACAYGEKVTSPPATQPGTPSVPAATGSVVPADPWTVCCE